MTAMLTTRKFGPYDISMIYYKSVVLLIVALPFFALYSGRKKTVWVSLCLFCILISGTRTNIILSIFLLSVIIAVLQVGRTTKFIINVTMIPIFCIILFYLISMVLNASDGSNATKFGNFYNYIDLISSSWRYVFYGDGVGSVFYSSSLKTTIAYSELTYFDLLHWFGLIPSFVICLMFCIPLYSFLYNRKLLLSASYISYLIVAGTNPLLFSTTGMLAMALFFSQMRGNNKKSLFIVASRQGKSVNVF
jgi:hypothetical protein